MGQRIVVFAPHPDDETFGCGGTIAKKVSEGYEVLVAVMTDGRYAYSNVFGIDTDPTPAELKRIRKAEVKRATKILGLGEEHLIFLDFEDGTLDENDANAEREVTRILRGHRPAEVYCVYEKDSHPDHRATCRIVDNSIRKARLHTMQYKYSISLRYGRIGGLIEALLSPFRHNTICVDISDFLHLKAMAIREFRSEVTIISERQGSPVVRNLNRFLGNKEKFFVDKRAL